MKMFLDNVVYNIKDPIKAFLEDEQRLKCWGGVLGLLIGLGIGLIIGILGHQYDQ
ncbi:hypothetical protein [Melissococcus plutonius]|uniref:hypothetical protein n=1 Tax=Melissococcus plutonius TaxID=33970 RepID=UPI003C3087F1